MTARLFTITTLYVSVTEPGTEESAVPGFVSITIVIFLPGLSSGKDSFGALKELRGIQTLQLVRVLFDLTLPLFLCVVNIFVY
jgi:hypothetical protein